MTNKKATTAETASTNIRMIPLCKLKKSPRNARKVPHASADIEALAASIAANGMLQSPVVEPETKEGKPTGYYLVTIGEGRRQAQLLRARRKEIARNEPVRCLVDALTVTWTFRKKLLRSNALYFQTETISVCCCINHIERDAGGGPVSPSKESCGRAICGPRPKTGREDLRPTQADHQQQRGPACRCML